VHASSRLIVPYQQQQESRLSSRMMLMYCSPTRLFGGGTTFGAVCFASVEGASLSFA
jgi:hypothetical protein